ncbi:acetolactate synthase [Allonocardiopsis opalescens]|uniref:Acetolactate synthase-1/2/3 large subunit n=1 Tax=Allonocardiopsis opalescens TaxID=1144618 RepID=A0A2T0QDV0_9ACTN|nr:acetolactate synthase [Allonocardiopsis opalescens]PRY02050.1 acetolactate synthase-1/2/3 large subunit [Allonocardiopsis opalescens]
MGETRRISGHAGLHAVEVARGYGVETMWTLSGAHVFPLYDGAVKSEPPLRLLDVRHEQTAVFGAEGTAKLTRTPGLAVVTAGPGVTNAVSGIATSYFNGTPLVVYGGRAPKYRWGSGLLQELDHPPLVREVTKHAGTVYGADQVAAASDDAFRTALSPHQGPVFLDVPMDDLYGQAETELPPPAPVDRLAPDPDQVAAVAALLAAAERPVFVFGSDIWLCGAEEQARAAAEALRVPVVANGQGRGILPHGHELLATRARGAAFGEADLVVVVGAPLDFRLGFGVFGGRDGAAPAPVVHIADSPGQLSSHAATAAVAAGDLGLILAALADAKGAGGPGARASWCERLAEAVREAAAKDAGILLSDADPVHPARIYHELNRQLDDDAVVIGDGGDFVSFAGKYVEQHRPGTWMDPGPYGCLGTGLGYALAARIARPSAQVVLLLGDGAAGFSLMDVDTAVRHRLPMVMVVGNNGIWGLEKNPMRFLYGYDVAADLAPQTRYDEVVRALGGGGELVTRPGDIAPALRRAFAAQVPYLVNIATDPDAAYPRSTHGI